MQPPQQTQFEEITKELYTKNVDLVNANKTLELIQKLYEIMISSNSLEDVSQRYIDTISTSLGFSDGIVVVADQSDENLSVSAITQSEINKTILEACNIHRAEMKLERKNTENALVRVFMNGKQESTSDIWRVWTPFVKQDDLSGVNTALGPQHILIYPIILGNKTLGSFALMMTRGSQQLTEFESNALSRLTTVFGLAIDRVRTNLELQETQKRELEKAKELLRLKDEFVFIATHDLRTPVTAISGFVDIIGEKSVTFAPDIQEDFEAIKQSSDRLKQLINDLLEVARSESGTIQVVVGDVNISEIIENVKKQQQPMAMTAQVTVESSLDQSAPLVRADKAKLTEVIENLVSNAIKYNRPQGSVKIISKAIDNYLEVSFSDTGYGIPKDKQPHVFQKFFRAHQAGTENVPGTGLGLFVVRMLIEKMGGTITFVSEENKGTTFTFRLQKA